MDYKVDVALPVYGESDKLDRCLTDFTLNTHVSYKLWVVDDFSPERFKKSLSKVYKKFSDYKTHPNIKIEKRPLNCGFGWTTNYAASKGDAEYILLLNSDVYVTDSCVDRMVDVLDTKPEVGVVGAKLLFPDSLRTENGISLEQRQKISEEIANTIQHAGVYFQGPAERVPPPQYGLPFHKWGGFSRDFSEACISKYVPCVTGALFLTRRSIWQQLNGMDWRTYKRGAMEDVDYALRTRDLGHKIWYEANAVAWHHQWGSGRDTTHKFADVNREALMKRWGDRITPGGDLHTV